MAKPYIVGLTGGIACGKSTVSALFRQHGVPVIDADMISRRLMTKSTPAYQAILDYFGSVCLKRDGSLDRTYLRRRIFSNPDEKRWLEALLHPLILEDCLKSLEDLPLDTAYVIFDIPLLLESNLSYPVDAVWVVDTSLEQQIQRLKNRDKLNDAMIGAMLEAQASRALRRKKADVLIENDKSLEELKEIVRNLHQKILQKLSK